MDRNHFLKKAVHGFYMNLFKETEPLQREFHAGILIIKNLTDMYYLRLMELYVNRAPLRLTL